MYFAQQYNKKGSATELDYSQFVSSVEAGNADSVTVHNEDRLITGITKDKTEFKVVMPDNQNGNVESLLLANHVHFKEEPPMRLGMFWTIVLNLAPYLL